MFRFGFLCLGVLWVVVFRFCVGIACLVFGLFRFVLELFVFTVFGSLCTCVLSCLCCLELICVVLLRFGLICVVLFCMVLVCFVVFGLDLLVLLRFVLLCIVVGLLF